MCIYIYIYIYSRFTPAWPACPASRPVSQLRGQAAQHCTCQPAGQPASRRRLTPLTWASDYRNIAQQHGLETPLP